MMPAKASLVILYPVMDNLACGEGGSCPQNHKILPLKPHPKRVFSSDLGHFRDKFWRCHGFLLKFLFLLFFSHAKIVHAWCYTENKSAKTSTSRQHTLCVLISECVEMVSSGNPANNQLLGTSFQKARSAFWGEARPGFGVHWYVYTNGHRSRCGLRDVRKGIGVQ